MSHYRDDVLPNDSVPVSTDPAGPEASPTSRRDLLKRGAATLGGVTLLAQAGSAQNSPAIQTGTTNGRKFRAFVRHGTTASVEELRLLPIGGRQVLVRTQASQCCYSITGQVLAQTPMVPALVPGHGGVGIVEAVGPQVKRVQVGDRVIVCDTSQCGECYNCLRGRAFRCQSHLRNPTVPYAQMADGTPVHQNGNHGSFGELMVPYEEYCVAVSTDLSAAELSLLSCTGATGLSTTMSFAPVEPGSSVVVFGAGPVGLSAIQGARIMGATEIVAVEPIRYRRELAQKLGATIVLDPNVEGANLVKKIQDLCKGPTTADRRFSGFRDGVPGSIDVGPDFVIECSGGDSFPPKAERGPDPTGLLALRQAWEVAPAGGDLFTVAVGQKGDLTFPANNWSNRGRTHHSGQLGGLSMKRDLPRYVRLIEKGLFDAKSIATQTYPLDRTLEAFQVTADRTAAAAVVVFG